MWAKGRLWLVVAVVVGYFLVAAVPSRVASLARPKAAEETVGAMEAFGGEELGPRGGTLEEAPLVQEAGRGAWGLAPLFALDVAVALLAYFAARRALG